MEFFYRRGYHFSKLSLGTVQLGMEYGISNANGKPTSAIASEIIDSALKAGITTLDTSESYGSAEEEIGRYLKSGRVQTQPVIVTKFKINVQSSYKIEGVREEIYNSLSSSLHRLKLEKIPVYLFHQGKHQQLQHVIEPLLIVFEELKEKGLVDIAGISAYGPEDVDVVLNYDILEAVQVPINILDHRLIKNGKLAQLKHQNKIVFARSVFLQGILFMKPEELPEQLQIAKRYIISLGEIAQAAGLTVPQLSFSFVNNMKAITSIVFGAVTKEQVNQNVALLKTPSLKPGIIELIDESFANVPELIITPGRW